MAIPIYTANAHITATSLLAESPQDTLDAFVTGGGGNIGWGSGGNFMKDAETSLKDVSQPCGIWATHSLYADIKKSSHLKGVVFAVNDDAPSYPCCDQSGNGESSLYEIVMPGDGDCALHCLGLKRDEAVEQLIKHCDDPIVQGLLLLELQEAINEKESVGEKIPGITNTPAYQTLQEELQTCFRGSSSHRSQESIEQDIQDYLSSPDILGLFLQHSYGTPQRGGHGKWLSYTLIKALAHVSKIHVIIKRRSVQGTLDTVEEFGAGNPDVKVLLHTLAGTRGGFYNPQGTHLNHFNLLAPRPGLFKSPEIIVEHVHNHNKNSDKSLGIQASVKDSCVLGYVQGGIQSSHQESLNRATVSHTIEILTDSQIDRLNRNPHNIREETRNDKRKIKAFVPFANDLPKTLEEAKASFDKVMDKGWWTGLQRKQDSSPPLNVIEEDFEDILKEVKESAVAYEKEEKNALTKTHEQKPLSKKGKESKTDISPLEEAQHFIENMTPAMKQRFVQLTIDRYSYHREKGATHAQACHLVQGEIGKAASRTAWGRQYLQYSLYKEVAIPLALPAAEALVILGTVLFGAVAQGVHKYNREPKNTPYGLPMDAPDYEPKQESIPIPDQIDNTHITPLPEEYGVKSYLPGFDQVPEDIGWRDRGFSPLPEDFDALTILLRGQLPKDLPAGAWIPPEEALDKIPDWLGIVKQNDKGEGIRWMDIERCRYGIRIDKGDLTTEHETQWVDHVCVIRNGQVIGRDGNPILRTSNTPKPKKAPEAHIPLSEWLKWREAFKK